MAQDILTVTPPNPSPPTNMTSSGATGPNPATFAATVYANPFNMDANGRPQAPYGVNPAPAPYYDDGVTQTTASGGVNENIPVGGAPLGTPQAFAAKKAALAVGGTSVDNEGLGTEIVTAKSMGVLNDFGSDWKKYGSFVYAPILMTTVGSGPTMTQALRDAGPNGAHASFLGGSAVPTVTATSAGGAAGPGTTLLTVTGTNFTRASVVYVSGIAQTTNYVSTTSLTVTNAPKKQTAGAGNLPVTVVNANGPTSNSFNWAFT
jgi:hypothetical protein